MQNDAHDDERKASQQDEVGGRPTCQIGDSQKDGADHNQRQSSILPQSNHNSQLSILNSQFTLLFLGCDEFVSLAMDVDDFNLAVGLQVLAQLGDIDIH